MSILGTGKDRYIRTSPSESRGGLHPEESRTLG